MRNNIKILVKNKLSPYRWKHSIGVTKTAREMARFWGCNVEKAELAGMLHDYARELPHQMLIDTALKMGRHIIDEEYENPVVLHAPVGAFLVQKELQIRDGEILSAIEKHTVGGWPLSLLDKIIFLADLTEPGRKWSGVNELRKMAYQDLNRTMLLALEGIIKYLQENNQVIHPLTISTRNFVQREINRF